MATSSYFEREAAFYKHRADLQFILGHPDLETPDHPYLPALRSMAEYAMFGVIDTSNEIMHLQGQDFLDSVIIAPVLETDLRVGAVSISDDLLKRVDEDIEYDFSSLSEASGNCIASPNVVSPIVSLAPFMNERHPIVVGCTIAHELDHAYWWLRRNSRYKDTDTESEFGIAIQEISAIRLEQQLLFAHLPDEYDEEYGKISLKYADLDFERVYNPRQADKLKKTVQIIAFINFMYDELGADVGVSPSSDLIRALKVQDLI